MFQRVRFIAAPQIQAIRAFLIFVQENADDGEWFRPFITRAMEDV